jgi:SAM-dependent methyltransferase
MNSDQPLVFAQCPLCAAPSSTAAVIAAFPELTWVRCTCGLIFKRSEIPDPAAGDFYESGYFGTGDQGRRYTERRRRRVQKSRNQILDLLNHAPRASLLDIGCSMGYALQAARELGLAATGMDISGFAVRQCQSLGFRAEQGELGNLPFANGEFGLVTMKHVLEHAPDQRAALREVHRVLAVGGGVFIAVPHGDYGKAARRPLQSKQYRPERHGREHFVYYTPVTLSKLLAEEGFCVARVNPALMHRQAPFARRIGELLVAPWRALGQAVADAANLRKEFWLVAIKQPVVQNAATQQTRNANSALRK